MNTFIQQEWIKLIKSDSKDIYNFYFYNSAVLLNFSFIKYIYITYIRAVNRLNVLIVINCMIAMS